ncbi:pyridoxal phosphate-dependent transferase [Lipomyces japonicus]|uniref:pyridoxal phosphate-dependent transferase n=1 Tax=Lipomyces japonicus TaxID=56871 RepID=UPI0034CEFC27
MMSAISRNIIRAALSARSSVSLRYNSTSAATQAVHQNSITHPDPTESSASAQHLRDFEPYVLTTYARPGLVLTSGKGAYLHDLEGRSYLDFNSGIAVNGLGNGDEELADILKQQALQIIHTSNLYYNEWTGQLCKLIVEQTHASGAFQAAKKVFLANSGSEANEAAIKFARKYGKSVKGGGDHKYEIVSFKNSFHGRTLGSLSATPNEKYQKPFQPLVPGFKVATYNDIESVYATVNENTCAVIIEPIQGEGGVYTATEEFIVALRKKCNEVGALLIFDEIQSGVGRSGNLWAHAAFPQEAQPDILTMAKALGNGIPIGAAMVTQEVAEIIKPGDHGTTFGGNPLASRAAHHVFGKIANQEFLNRVKQKAEIFRAGLETLKEKYPSVVIEVRGTGLIWGLQLSFDPSKVVDAARLRGLLVITAGHNTVRIVPPLVITEDEISEGLSILDNAIASTL